LPKVSFTNRKNLASGFELEKQAVFTTNLSFSTMKKMLILVCLCLYTVSNALASDLILTNTGNAQLDGTYKPFEELNGAMSFIKNTEGVTFKIARFKFETNNTLVFGWTISDSNNNEYFAVTDEGTQTPTQGWDVARAGVGLNVNFDLTFRSTVQPDENFLTLTNAPSLDISVYPNPTIGEITIVTDQGLQNVSVVNLSGQVLISSQNNRIDLSGLPSGIYNLIVQTKDTKVVKRVIKK
jgi:Secretion system C-terminal sorting domain